MSRRLRSLNGQLRCTAAKACSCAGLQTAQTTVSSETLYPMLETLLECADRFRAQGWTPQKLRRLLGSSVQTVQAWVCCAQGSELTCDLQCSHYRGAPEPGWDWQWTLPCCGGWCRLALVWTARLSHWRPGGAQGSQATLEAAAADSRAGCLVRTCGSEPLVFLSGNMLPVILHCSYRQWARA